MNFFKNIILAATFFIVVYPSFSKDKAMNVLFIAVDDLRPELGCYGINQIKSPNIDRLAQKGTLFNRAYCQQAVCSPSRTSLMTGLRPDATKVFDLQSHFRTTIPDVVTLPQYFRMNGYYTKSFGKIYHGILDDPLSWSDNPDNTLPPDSLKQKIKSVVKQEIQRSKSLFNVKHPAWECKDLPDNAFGDGQMTESVIELLRDEKIKEKPFFLAVGFRKPHLSFIAPKKYWDMYDASKIDKAKNPFLPANVPDIALTNWEELRRYEDIPQVGPLSEEQAATLKHGYYACVSYIDAQIGLLLDELDRLGLSENTIVILWGDHGWKLGEHAMWCKHTNFEVDTHSPLICYSPKQKLLGTKTDALVEFVDIYPSLCELAGLKVPSGLAGKSFAPLLNDPSKKWKKAAFSQYPRPGGVMGYSIRTNKYRLTQWINKQNQVIATELYDHQADPQENRNIAGFSENEELIISLSKQLQESINHH